MTEPLLRDGLSDFGRGLFEAADSEAPSPAARDALLAAIAGTAAATAAVATASATASVPAAAVKTGLATHAGASAGAGVATKGAAALGAKLLVASAISVATTAVVVGELRSGDAPIAPAVVATVGSGAASRPRGPVAPAAATRELAEGPSVDQPMAPSHEDEPTAPSPAHASADEPTAIVHGPPVRRTLLGPAEPAPDAAREEASASTDDDGPPSTSAPTTPPPARDATPEAPGATAGPPPAEAPAVAHSPRAAASDESANAASLGAQIASIDAARAELRAGHARDALATIEAFERRYGKSAPLSPEAMLVRVQAHLVLGERRLAESAAAALLREHPSSVSARRAASLVGAGD